MPRLRRVQYERGGPNAAPGAAPERPGEAPPIWGGTFTRWLLTEEGHVIARRRRQFQYHPEPAPVVRLRAAEAA